MDDIDKGNYQAELTLQAYIERVRRRAGLGPKPTGKCFNCDEIVDGERLFCDPECREDFERRNPTKR